LIASGNKSVAAWQFKPGSLNKAQQYRPKPIKQNILIAFHNQNNKALQVALRYEAADGQWVTGGWYKLEPNEKKSIVETGNTVVYVYAESIAPKDSRVYWDGTDRHYPVNNSDESYGFKKYNTKGHELVIQFPPQ
jgi:uncharacterized membrane protein